MVERIAARNDPPYFVIHGAWRADERIVVICRPPVELMRGHVLDLAATIQTLQSGERCIVNPTIYARLEQNGSISNRPPLFDSLPVLQSRLLSQPTSPIPPSDPTLPNDGLGLPGPVTAWLTDSAWQGGSISELLANPPPLLSRVVLSCKPIREVGDGFIVVGDDNTTTAVKVYTNHPVKPGDRIVKLIGYAHSENGSPVIYSDTGPSPYFDSQGELGSVFSADHGNIAWAKTMSTSSSAALPGLDSRFGPTRQVDAGIVSYPIGPISLTGKTVAAVFYSSGTVESFYVQEPGRQCGIKVVSNAAVDIRDVVSVGGTVTCANGEAYIIPTSVTVTGSEPLPRPLGMSNRCTAGGQSGAQPALYVVPGSTVGSGLSVVGIRAKVWGRVTYVTEDRSVCYIDDGSRLSRSDHLGLKVVYYRPEDHADVSEGDILTATGILGAETDDGDPVPVVRVPNRRAIHAKPDGDDEDDGYRWDTAKATIQEAIDTAADESPKCEVWVAAGPYDERTTLASGVRVYGGFAAVEEVREERNWAANATVIDGGNTGTTGSVVTIPSGVSDVVLDGFTIQHGLADKGAGIYCQDASGAIVNNVIRDNAVDGSPSNYGAGLYASNSTLVVVGNVFVGNCASTEFDACGGAIYYASTGGHIANNTLVSNRASWNAGAGGIYLTSGSPTISNNIIAFNTGGGICSSGSPVLQNNDVYDNGEYNYSGVSPGAGDISADPDIPKIGSGDWHLAGFSPCVNAGWNGAPALPTLDIDGERRDAVDVGADEWNGTDPETLVIHVMPPPDGDDDNNGTNWTDDAVATVQRGIDLAYEGGGGEVWVAAGTYEDTNAVMSSFVRIYGGFAGTESQREERDWNTNLTVLDGSSGGSVITLDNVFGCQIDGFTIQHGLASRGGGVYCWAASPVIRDNNIVANVAGEVGGGVYCSASLALITDNTMQSNTAVCGGGICSMAASPQILRNTIDSNTAEGEGDPEGGGLYCIDSPSPLVTSNTFVGNYGATHGGGIALHGCGSMAISNNLFLHNHTAGPGVWGGGAIHSKCSGPTIVNNTFVENWVGSGDTFPPATPRAYGGAVHVRFRDCAPKDVTILNNIFYDNRALRGNGVACTEGGQADISYCDAYPGLEGDNYYADPGSQYSLLDVIRYVPPGFYDADNDKYWLSLDSALRQDPNHGQNHAENPVVPEQDIGEHPRPGDDYTDMGAYESDPGNYP